MRKQAKVVIEGLQYELSQMGATEGRVLVVLFLKLLGRLAPIFVKLVGEAKGSNGAKLDPGAIDVEAMGPEAIGAIGEVIASVDAKELEPLWDAFSRHAYVRGKDGTTVERLSDTFDEHFAGEYFAMTKFFIESAKLNFGDFLGKALSTASAKQNEKPSDKREAAAP